MINTQSSTGSIELEFTHGARRPIIARLQCFAAYADEPAIDDDAFPAIPIHDLSRQNAATSNIPDLRRGAIVRLLIPAIGWRHLQVHAIRGGMTRYRFLLPLTPHELRAVHDAAGRNVPIEPPHSGPWSMASLPLRAHPASSPPGQRRTPPVPLPGGKSRPGLIAAFARWAEAILTEPMRIG